MFGTSLATLLLSATFTPAFRVPIDDSDQRTRYLISRLDVKIPQLAQGEQPLTVLLENLPLLTSEPGFEKDPSLQFRISVDEKAFKRFTEGFFDQEKEQIKFTETMRNEPLSAVLQIICQKLDGAYVIRKHHIEIIPLNLLRKELHLSDDDETDFFPLIHWIGTEIPLERVFQDLNRSYDANVVISTVAKEKAKTAITARLLNTPLEAAVESLAEMAGLQLVRKSNVLLITTKEHASSIHGGERKKRREEINELKKKADIPMLNQFGPQLLDPSRRLFHSPPVPV